MVALIKLVPGIAAFLFFSATSATPVERTDVQELSNSTFIAENDRPFSVQILLLRNTGTEFWWQMYQGPALVAVQPCRYIEPFKFAHFKGPYNYNPNAINNPPNAPAVS
ncbi:hypothetical protein DDE82_008626 [Stemphylium lycopersici]|nr:hypothetical protein DDE82_008626 [Stemphylium lycopersici]